MIKRGEIYDYDFGAVGTDNRQAGHRPALVVQTDLLNQVEGYGLTLVVPISTKGRAAPSHVRLDPSAESGLSHVSYAKCEQILTVPTRNLGPLRGSIGKATMYQINQALRIVLGLE